MTGKLFGGAATFFAACVLIYFGVKFLTEIWWILAILIVIVAALVMFLRIRRNRPKW
jgi:uncharacterized membrane protein